MGRPPHMPESGSSLGPARDRLGSGTLVFLFTDIEGSTERWERAPQTMNFALARHDGVLHAAIKQHGGQVFKTMGDAFCAAFSNTCDALAAALAAQRAITSDGFTEIGGLKVRMAVHAGAVAARDGDYFGQPLNRIGRLLAAGHGGQVLVSAVAADLARGSLPDGSRLANLGAHRLKDFAEPQEIYQLIAPDLASEFPPLRSLVVSGTIYRNRSTHLSAAKQKWPTSRRFWKSIASSRWSARGSRQDAHLVASRGGGAGSV